MSNEDKLILPKGYIQKPLPVLKVVQETYCSQEMTDSCIAYLEQIQPDLFIDLHEKSTTYTHNFTDILAKMDQYLLDEGKSGNIKIPEDYLGSVDLFFELSRRFESRYGFEREQRQINSSPDNPIYELLYYKVQGNPLGATPEGPYLPLPRLEISNYSSREELSQAVADDILQRLYDKYPRLWFCMGEEVRRSITLYRARDELTKYMQEILLIEYGDPYVRIRQGVFLRDRLLTECRRRIYSMCGFPIHK